MSGDIRCMRDLHAAYQSRDQSLFFLEASTKHEGIIFFTVTVEMLLTDFTMVALPAVTTDALVHANFVDASSSIAAWVTLTVIDV